MVSALAEPKPGSLGLGEAVTRLRGAFARTEDSMAYSGDLDYRDGRVWIEALMGTDYRIVASQEESELTLVGEIEDPLEAFYLLDLLEKAREAG